MKKRIIKNWVNKVKCGSCKNKIKKSSTKITKEGKRVCKFCFKKYYNGGKK